MIQWPSLVSRLPPWLDGTTNQWHVHGKSSALPGSLVHRPRTKGQDNTYRVCGRSVASFGKINILDALIKLLHGA